jgi:hypothetical protein
MAGYGNGYYGPGDSANWPTVASSWESPRVPNGFKGFGGGGKDNAALSFGYGGSSTAPSRPLQSYEDERSEKARLIGEIRRRDDQLGGLRAEAERLREQHEALLAAFTERAATLESRLLHGHVEAVRGAPPQGRPLPPEFARPQRLVVEQELQRREAARQAALIDPTIPPGGRVVSVVYRGAGGLEDLPPTAPPQEAPAPKEKETPTIMGEGRLLNSNFVMTPSPHHPMSWLNTQGQMGSIYPISRPPMGNYLLQGIFPSFIRPSPEFHPQEGTWTREANFFTRRDWPVANWTKETQLAEDRIGRKGGFHEVTSWRQVAA